MAAKKTFNINTLLKYEDPRAIPTYSVAETAHYLTIPTATLRSWVLGREYTDSFGMKRRFQRVITLPQRDTNLLSFFNLVEAHILRAFRKKHGIKLKHIRLALNYVKRQFGWKRPLIEQEFRTDGASLLIEHLGKLVDASAAGQTVMRNIVESHLKRLEWEDKVVVRLYPFTRGNDSDSPQTVLIDPRFSFGRPILRDSHIETAVIAERYKAGDSVELLADDYGCSRLDIEEGLRCELSLQDAA